MLVVKNDFNSNGKYEPPCVVSFETEKDARVWIENEINGVKAELIEDGTEYYAEEGTCRMYGNGKTEWFVQFNSRGNDELSNIISWTMLEAVPAASSRE